MAQLKYAASDTQTRKLFSKRLLIEALRDSAWGVFLSDMSEDPSSVICLKKEPSSDAGDTVTISLQRQLQGDGVQGDTPLEGNEESMTEFTMQILLDELRHADKMAIKGMTKQRVEYDKDPRVRLKNALKDWWSERLTMCAINQLCGNTSTSLSGGTKYTGNNACTAADANHSFYGGAVSDAQSCTTASQNMSLDLIDKMVAKASSYTLADGTGVPLKKAKILGQDAYALIMHEYVWYSLKTSLSSTANSITDIAKYLYSGKGPDNPITKGYLKSGFKLVGQYNGVWLFTDARMPKGQHSSTTAYVNNTRRSVLLGANALTAAFGMGYGSGQMEWTEKTFDYDKWLGIASGLVFGMKKTVFNSLDYGVAVATTYSALG